MGKTKHGWSAPYCLKCEKHTLKLQEKFGEPCPLCKTKTVNYADYETKRYNVWV